MKFAPMNRHTGTYLNLILGMLLGTHSFVVYLYYWESTCMVPILCKYTFFTRQYNTRCIILVLCTQSIKENNFVQHTGTPTGIYGTWYSDYPVVYSFVWFMLHTVCMCGQMFAKPVVYSDFPGTPSQLNHSSQLLFIMARSVINT